MLTINLTNVEKSDIKYTISHFPDGEVQITLDEFPRKNQIEVRCRITSAEELFLVKQVFDILDRSEVIYSIFISYLMSMRMDRVMNFNRPFTLKVVTDILKGSKARDFEIFEPHSERSLDELNAFDISLADVTLVDFSRYQIVIPDAGAAERYQGIPFFKGAIFCSKVRDVETGQILHIQVDNPEKLSDKPLLIIDDLCDGGGTFLGIAEAIRAIKPNVELDIHVAHAVNKSGLLKLSTTFNHVYITNSYKDWKKEMGDLFPTNITQIEVI